MALAVLFQFGFSPEALFTKAVEVHSKHDAIMAPGALIKDPISAISVGMALMFGTAGLPHILMRFFTVTDAKEARKSVLYASGIVAYFFNVIFLMGLCAILIVGQNAEFFEGGTIGGKLIGGGNMVAMHLAKAVGGDLLLGFMAAVAFATILAVVSGLALAGASAISHDLYSRVIMKGKATEAAEIRVSRIATITLGVVAIILGILFEKQNVAFMVGLAFGVAAAGNFPVLILSMYWKGLTTRGALMGGYGGLISAVAFVVFSKSVWVDVLANKAALFPYSQPALFAMPIAFLLAYIFSKSDASVRGRSEIAAFDDQYVRAQTGFGASTATSH
ncbi:MAG: cation acetate symporter, partial [Candidatus Methylophosphatis roskildensis]